MFSSGSLEKTALWWAKISVYFYQIQGDERRCFNRFKPNWQASLMMNDRRLFENGDAKTLAISDWNVNRTTRTTPMLSASGFSMTGLVIYRDPSQRDWLR
ncbi:hypothetical protein DESC_970012 [Desulfosarcina cetonica]|nr:hypothetical protein DESC_970012 [Desulfosarcina cetonica]